MASYARPVHRLGRKVTWALVSRSRAIWCDLVHGEVPARSREMTGDGPASPHDPGDRLSVRSSRRRCPHSPGSSRTAQAVENSVTRRIALPSSSGSMTSEPADGVGKKSSSDLTKDIGSRPPLALRVRNAPRQLLKPQGCVWSAESRAFGALLRPPGQPSGPEHHRRGSEPPGQSEAADLPE